MQKIDNGKMVVMMLVALAVIAVAGSAFALGNGGAAGDTGYELYDLVVNKLIKGSIGAAAGTGFMVVGAVMAALGKVSAALWPLIGGGMLASASALANSLGMLF